MSTANVALVLAVAIVGLLPPAASGAHPVVLGANTDGITEDTAAALDSFAAESGVQPGIAEYFQDWNPHWSTALLNPRFINPILARGAVPLITWMPTLDGGGPIAERAYAPRHVAAGRFDAYIHRAAVEVREFGRPVMIRLAHEMNGDWSPWGAGVSGNTPRDYRQMWRHVVRIFDRAGATNARWVWAPNVYGRNDVRPFKPFYPGDRWVDYTALDGYNWGAGPNTRWLSFGQVFGYSYRQITRLSDRPLLISETSSSEVGGSKAAWIGNIEPTLTRRMPRVRALVWFDRDKEMDWRIDSSSGSLAAFRSLAGSSLFSKPVAGLLQLALRPKPQSAAR